LCQLTLHKTQLTRFRRVTRRWARTDMPPAPSDVLYDLTLVVRRKDSSLSKRLKAKLDSVARVRQALLVLLCIGPAASQQNHKTWRDYGGGLDSSHYVALTQIN